MSRILWALALPLALLACDDVRKQECERFVAAMKPLDEGTPSSATVDGVIKQIDAMTFQNQPLGVYQKNYRKTLEVLVGTLKLKEGGSPPDGTDAVIKQNLKDARTAREDVARYCAP